GRVSRQDAKDAKENKKRGRPCSPPLLSFLALLLPLRSLLYGRRTSRRCSPRSTCRAVTRAVGASELPALRHLGLRNSEIVDAIAARLGRAPVLGRLRALDLSLGTLTGRGAEALLAIPGLAKLERLDLHYNYLSPEMAGRVAALGPAVDAGDNRVEDYW